MAAARQAQQEFDTAYPRLVAVAFLAARRFFRFDATVVEDVVAETMARTFERWERVRRHENPSGWVVVCTKNVCLEQLRAGNRDTTKRAWVRSLPRPATDYSEQCATSDAITRTLAQLSKRQRDVAVLRYLMDLDEATTACALGMSISQVKTAAHEARGRLRVLLAEMHEPEVMSA